jgi:sulfite reductase (NADPH) hemoprotein beta-component
MYQYNELDHKYVRQRIVQFRDQIDRRLSGSLNEEEFKPLRLHNGLYAELHAYMLRVAIPYGTLRSDQLRQLAMIAEKWDRGYGHFTTRHNIQFNWLKLNDVPDVLEALADVEMHAIQTSGNCIRSVTTDQFAGIAQDEIEDPRPTAEFIRQWALGHPEFAFLPRKFKIAVTGSGCDRAAIQFQDLGLRLVRTQEGEVGYEVNIGGGLGRTPVIAQTLREFLAKSELLPYLEATLRIYNLYGRRDNKHKARSKILVLEEGLEQIKKLIEAEHARLLASPDELSLLPNPEELARIEKFFQLPDVDLREGFTEDLAGGPLHTVEFNKWQATNTAAHKMRGYCYVTAPLNTSTTAPGDLSAKTMRALADLADQFSFGEIRFSNEQNLILPHVDRQKLPALYDALHALGLTAIAGSIGDIVACPGMDYCSLATARSIPIAQKLTQRFADPDYVERVGQLKIKISGCVNACGQHHIGDIGVLGLEKAGVESYQIVLGGNPIHSRAAIAEKIGPSFSADDVVLAIDRLIETYLNIRQSSDETFIQTYTRVGAEPFRAALYGENRKAA